MTSGEFQAAAYHSSNFIDNGLNKAHCERIIGQ